MEFEIWHIWLMVAIVFFTLEIFIPSFIVINFGVGALFATLIAAAGGSLQWQLFFFSIFTLASFFSIRPILKKWAYKRSDKVETNVNAMIGRTGIVTEKIDAAKNTGLVKIDGDIWQAITADGGVIGPGTIVQVVKLDSIILTVKIKTTISPQ